MTINLGTDAHSRGFAQGVTLTSIEHIIGSPQADTIIGNDKDNIIEGGTGADRINGGAGNDTVSYENAAGRIAMTLNNVLQDVGSGDALNDRLMGIENIIGSNFNDSIGSTFHDELAGNNLANIIDGGAGDDVIYGLQGNDSFVLGTADKGSDVVADFSYGTASGRVDWNGSATGGNDRIRVDVDATGKANIDNAVTDADKLEALKNAANIYWTQNTDSASANFSNALGDHDTIIYRIVGLDDRDNGNSETDDIAALTLLDFSETLTIDMFDII